MGEKYYKDFEIGDGANFIIDTVLNLVRISYFEDGHFRNELVLDKHEFQEIVEAIKNWRA